MSETPQPEKTLLDMHIYLRGKDVPIYLHGIEAETAYTLEDSLTPDDDTTFWYDFEHKARAYRVYRPDVQLVSTEEMYVNPARHEEPMPAVAEPC